MLSSCVIPSRTDVIATISFVSKIVMQDGGEVYAEKEPEQGTRNKIAWPDRMYVTAIANATSASESQAVA